MSSRLLPLLVGLLVALPACGPSAAQPETQVDDRGLLVSRLRDAVADVAAAQGEADAALLDALEVIRELDERLVEFRDVERLDDAVEAWTEQAPDVGSVDVEPLREGFIDTALAVDSARSTLANTRRRLDDPWEVEYLDAEDDVLMTVRDYAETADRLAQLVQRHWPVYERLQEQLASFVERRWFFRSTQEAADALTVELDPLLRDVAVAQQQIADYRQRRAEVAADVNTATDAALDVWDRRPADQPTDAGT